MTLKELRDFKDTPYYKHYTDMIDEYGAKVIKSIVSQQGIDTEKRFTRGDVLRETLKFINTDLKNFKDLEIVNPSRTEQEEKDMQESLERQSKQMLGMN